MSSLRWLEAGATASYGTVVEPCNHLQKFPFPGIAMFHYALGASAIEAYWKSVAWPGEGVFVGEPLSQPFAPDLKEVRPGQFELQIFSPRETRLRIERSQSAAGPFQSVAAANTDTPWRQPRAFQVFRNRRLSPVALVTERSESDNRVFTYNSTPRGSFAFTRFVHVRDWRLRSNPA